MNPFGVSGTPSKKRRPPRFRRWLWGHKRWIGAATLGLLAIYGLPLYVKESHFGASEALDPVPFAYRTTGLVGNAESALGRLNELRPLAYEITHADRPRDPAYGGILAETTCLLLLGMPYTVLCMVSSRRPRYCGFGEGCLDFIDVRLRNALHSKWQVLAGMVLVLAWLMFVLRRHWAIELCGFAVMGLGLLATSLRSDGHLTGNSGGSWSVLKTICTVQLAVGFGLAVTVAYLAFYYQGAFPSVECGSCEEFQKIVKDAATPDKQNIGATRLTEQARALDALPSALDPEVNHSWNNPFYRAYSLATLYLFLAVAAVVSWLWLHVKSDRNSAPFQSLLATVISYLAVGFVFAVVYHALYISDAAKYNTLLWPFFKAGTSAVDLTDASSGPDSNAASVPDTNSPDTTASAPLDANPDFLRAALIRSPNLGPLLGMIRARTQSAAVFAQDRPRMVLDPSRLGQAVPVHSVTVQFDFRKTKIEDSKDKDIVAQNDAAVQGFRKFLRSLHDAGYPDSLTYEVTFAGGADRVGGNENYKYAQERVAELALQLKNVMGEQCRKVDGQSQPERRRCDLLQRGFLDAKILDLPVEPKTDSTLRSIALQSLWPEGIPDEDASPEGISRLWRSASAVINIREPDPASAALKMELSEYGCNFEDMVYFSFATFATTGFGDIRPVSRAARFFVILQNILGVVFVGILLASVIGKVA